VSSRERSRSAGEWRTASPCSGIGTLLILPGAPLTIPLVAKLGKALGVDVFPSEVEAEMT